MRGRTVLFVLVILLGSGCDGGQVDNSLGPRAAGSPAPSTPSSPSTPPKSCSGTFADHLHFAPPASIAAGSVPGGSAANDLVLARLRGAANDLAVFFRRPDPGGGGIAVFANQGRGALAFESAVDLGDAVPYRGLAVDFDGDGRLDLAAYCINAANQVVVKVALRTANGFGPVQSYAIPGQALPGFMTAGTPIFAGNGGAIEVATLDTAGTSTLVYTLRPAGVDPAVVTLPQIQARDVAGADFNGDGLLDFAAVDESQLHIFAGQSGGGATLLDEKSLKQSDEPTQILLGDFNQDHVVDMHTLQESCYDFYDPTPASPGDPGDDQSYQLNLDPTTREAAGDINGDGRPEIVVSGSDSTLAILILRPDGRVDHEVDSGDLGLTIDFGQKLDDFSLAVGDLDGDGVADVVVGQRAAAGSSLTSSNAPLLQVLVADGCVPSPGPTGPQ